MINVEAYTFDTLNLLREEPWYKSMELKEWVEVARVKDRQGEDQLWVSALACAEVVGKYEKGGALALASELKRSRATVEDRARAVVTYRDLCSQYRDNSYQRDIISMARAHLTISHFAALGRAMRTMDIPPDRAVDVLFDTMHAHGSVQVMMDYIRSEFGTYLSPWRKGVEKLTKELEKLSNDYDVPPGLRQFSRAAMVRLEKVVSDVQAY